MSNPSEREDPTGTIASIARLEASKVTMQLRLEIAKAARMAANKWSGLAGCDLLIEFANELTREGRL